jgi:MFS family permease
VVSCAAFALAQSFWLLLVARLLGGVGVCACMMAPLTGFRSWLSPQLQLRANSWILMSGSFGLLAATLPVQWAMEGLGWRQLFGVLAAVFLVTILATAWQLPAWPQKPAGTAPPPSLWAAYKPIFGNPYFHRIAPLAFVNYAVLLAIQTLWAGSWMMKVAGYDDVQASSGLFGINLTMLVVFWIWGTLNPRLTKAGLTADRMMTWGMPLGIAALVAVAAAGSHAGWIALAGFCVASSFLSLTHPAVALAFPANEAGRAVSAFNLLLFTGAFAWQWGIGEIIDVLRARGWSAEAAHQAAFVVLAIACTAGYLWYALGMPRSASVAKQALVPADEPIKARA